ncbi:DUF1080 domain-containing protein [bacterium]|nr:DUF1080 domain-containing protein [bacterium]
MEMMKHCISIGLTLAFAVLMGLNGMAEDKKWDSLFNGKNLKGWKEVHEVTFDVHEKNLRLVKGMGWLRTEKQYADFILEFETQALKDEDYDSGLFFRVGLKGKPWPKNGWQVNLKHDALGTLVRGYRPMIKAETKKVPVGKWMQFRLTVKGETAQLELNGKKLWEADFIDTEKGYIGIQAENKSFAFRNIKIQPLKK